MVTTFPERKHKSWFTPLYYVLVLHAKELSVISVGRIEQTFFLCFFCKMLYKNVRKYIVFFYSLARNDGGFFSFILYFEQRQSEYQNSVLLSKISFPWCI